MSEIPASAIETGDPKTSGRFVCYYPGVDVPTIVRFYLVGTGWLNYLHEPLAPTEKIAGWIGPLPCWPENSVKNLPPVQEFDL